MKEHILVVLPELSEDVVEKVEEVLRELGIESEKELRFVEEKDQRQMECYQKLKRENLLQLGLKVRRVWFYKGSFQARKVMCCQRCHLNCRNLCS